MYSFRACPSTTGKRSSPDIEQERDEWYKVSFQSVNMECQFVVKLSLLQIRSASTDQLFM